MPYAVNLEKKARCHCDQLSKRKHSECPQAPSLVLLPFPFTHGLCAVTWLWAVLKLWGRGWDFNERSGVSVYITVAMKSSHEIRALVMIGSDYYFFFKEKNGRKGRLYPRGFLIQMLWDLERVYPLTHGESRSGCWAHRQEQDEDWSPHLLPHSPALVRRSLLHAT